MAGTLVFVPAGPDQARSLVAGDVLTDVAAFSVTDDMLDTVGLTRADDEDAERACLLLASIAGLAAHGVRLVLVADVATAVPGGPDQHNGGVTVARLSLSQVESFFTDAQDNPLVVTGAAACSGQSLDDAWELEPVQALLRGADPLWNAAEELAVWTKEI